MPRTLTNFYRFNTTDLTFTQYHPRTMKMKTYHKLSPTSYLVGVVARSISMLSNKALSPYNFKIQFLMYTKLLTHA